MSELQMIVAGWVITGFAVFVRTGRAYREITTVSWLGLSGIALFCVLFWPFVCVTWPETKRNIQGN